MLRKSLLLKILLLLGSVVLALGAAELGFRRWGESLDPNARGIMPREGEGRCYRPSLTLGYEPRPGACQFNEHGYEAPGHSLVKPAGTFRVLVLGDSLSAGQAWVRGVEQRLKQQLPGRRVELWNGGIPGFDTCSELRALKERGWQIDPDLVLLQFCVNDFTVTATVIPLADGRLRYYVGEEAHDLPAWLVRSRLLTHLVVRLGLLSGGRVERGPLNERYVRRCVKLLAQETAARQVPLSALLFPVLVSGQGTAQDQRMLGDHRASERLAAAIFRQAGVDAIDLRPAMERPGPLHALRQFAADPWHPNLAAQKLVIRPIADHLASRYLKRPK